MRTFGSPSEDALTHSTIGTSGLMGVVVGCQRLGTEVRAGVEGSSERPTQWDGVDRLNRSMRVQRIAGSCGAGSS